MISFRTRSRERDQQSDLKRKARLQGVLVELHDEIEAERNGLKARMDEVSRSAAFAMQECEYGDTSAAVSMRLDHFTDDLDKAAMRLGNLERQSAFVGSMIGQIKNWN